MTVVRSASSGGQVASHRDIHGEQGVQRGTGGFTHTRTVLEAHMAEAQRDGKEGWESPAEVRTYVLFSCQKVLGNDTAALSFVFDKHCLIIE